MIHPDALPIWHELNRVIHYAHQKETLEVAFDQAMSRFEEWEDEERETCFLNASLAISLRT